MRTLTERRQWPGIAEQVDALAPHVFRGATGENGALFSMGAMVPGAHTVDDCVNAGWPRWLAHTIAHLYDAETGVLDEETAARKWLREVARDLEAGIHPVPCHELFLIGVLREVEGHDKWVTQAAIGYIERRLHGAEVTEQLDAMAAFAQRSARQVTGRVKYVRRSLVCASVTDPTCDSHGPTKALEAAMANASIVGSGLGQPWLNFRLSLREALQQGGRHVAGQASA